MAGSPSPYDEWGNEAVEYVAHSDLRCDALLQEFEGLQVGMRELRDPILELQAERRKRANEKLDFRSFMGQFFGPLLKDPAWKKIPWQGRIEERDIYNKVTAKAVRSYYDMKTHLPMARSTFVNMFHEDNPAHAGHTPTGFAESMEKGRTRSHFLRLGAWRIH